MPTLIPVTRRFSVTALLDIHDADFARWYSHGVWWALYGDYQGTGLYEDSYLIGNITHGIHTGWYDKLPSEHLTSSGFYLGMIHGGNIHPQTHVLRQTESIVVLIDPDFTHGYYVGREAPRDATDTVFMHTLHTYATTHALEHPLSYELGTWIGTLSRALIPRTMPATPVP